MRTTTDRHKFLAGQCRVGFRRRESLGVARGEELWLRFFVFVSFVEEEVRYSVLRSSSWYSFEGDIRAVGDITGRSDNVNVNAGCNISS